jgi:predicted ATPase/DNA-binding SARP family transcriptional activator
VTGDRWGFGVLGPLSITRDGVAVPVAGGLPRTVVVLLLAGRGAPQSPDKLIDQIWGERAPARVHSSFHVHLSKVRKALGDLLVKRDGGYLLDPERYELDSDLFGELANRASGESASDAAATLRDALALWRGTALADLPASETVDRWRRELEEARRHAIVRRIDADLAGGADRELVGELNRLVSVHPYEEKLAEQLMLALYRSGRQAEAHDAFHRIRGALSDELGLDPGDGLRQLQNRMLAHDTTLLLNRDADAHPGAVVTRDGSGAGSGSDPVRLPSARLPQPLTRLVGREQELSDLAQLSTYPSCRLLTLTGPGGVGKTRLSLEHASRWAPSFSGGAIFIDLARLNDAAQVRAEVAATIAAQHDSSDPTESSLGSYLAGRELLLVLDNFEHVLAAASIVAELLDRAPGLRIVASSRVPLRLRGEHVFEVKPLSVSVIGDPGGGPAVELFIQGALAVSRDFEASQSNRATIADICRTLDGLPLAIELAAPRIRTLTVEQIYALLERPLDVGGAGMRDLPERQRTLEATIGWSYALLSAPARQVLRNAAVFQGAFSSEALAAVCGAAVTDELEELLEASLLRRASDPARFTMLMLVRSFALARLDAEPAEEPLARARHRSYFCGRYQGTTPDSRPAEIGRTARVRAPDHADLRAAAEHAMTAGDSDAAMTLLMALQPLWMAGHLAESGPILDLALAQCSFSPKEEMALMSFVCYANSTRPEGEDWTRRRVARATELGQLGSLVAAIANQIAEALDNRDLEEALRHRDELLALTPVDSLKPGPRAARESSLSACAYLEGDLAAAVEYANVGVEIANTGAHPHALAVSMSWQLVVETAATGTIRLDELRERVSTAIHIEVPDVALTSLWLCARYAAGIDPEAAAEFLGLAEHLATAHDLRLWPEDELRDETLQILGVADAGELAARTSPRDPAASLAVSAEWLAGRPEGETATRARPAALGVEPAG